MGKAARRTIFAQRVHNLYAHCGGMNAVPRVSEQIAA